MEATLSLPPEAPGRGVSCRVILDRVMSHDVGLCYHFKSMQLLRSRVESIRSGRQEASMETQGLGVHWSVKSELRAEYVCRLNTC